MSAPSARPGTIIGIGENYGTARTEPLVFGKFPGSVIGDGVPIVVDAALTGFVVAEGELALVIGRTVRGLRTEAEALAALAGVTIANDVSARDLQARDGQSSRGKSLDTFCPLGPVTVAFEALGDEARLVTKINGRTVQDAALTEMTFSPAELVMFCSAYLTLRPGDVILTGTPVASDESLRLVPGDEVAVTIDGIGTLTNPVAAA